MLNLLLYDHILLSITISCKKKFKSTIECKQEVLSIQSNRSDSMEVMFPDFMFRTFGTYKFPP